MKEALFGLVGVLLGILLGEVLRRRRRIENYSVKVFEKRLDIHEELLAKLRTVSEVTHEVIDSDDFTKDQRLEIVSASVQDIAGFCDEHELYISGELAVQCVGLLMGTEDIHDISDPAERERRERDFGEQVLSAKRMLREEAGVAGLDRLFRSVLKPKYASPIVDYYRELKKKHGIKGRW